MLAAFAPAVEAQRSRGEAERTQDARRSSERAGEARRAQEIRPRDARAEPADGRCDEALSGVQAQRQARRATAAREDAQNLRRREMRQERRLEAALDSRDQREVLRGMFTEVGVHRDRMARVQRLRRIMEARGDDDAIRRIQELESAERRRFEGLMGTARRRVSAEDLRRFDEQVGPSSNTGVRGAGEREGGR